MLLTQTPKRSLAAMTDTREKELNIEQVQLKKAVLLFRAIKHPLRQQMLALMHQGGQMTVTNPFTGLSRE